MAEKAQPWDQMEGEPDQWFARFEMYKQLGFNRSLRLVNGLLHGMDGPTEHAGGTLWRASSQWNWPQRAQAWDKEQARQLSAMEQDRRLAAREERLAIIDTLLKAVSKVLVTADMGSMGRYEARAWIPAMRLMLKDLLAAQRLELGIMDGSGQTDNHLAQFRADDFLAASEELVAWSKAQEDGRHPDGAQPNQGLGQEAANDEAQDQILGREMVRMLHALYGEAQDASAGGEADHDRPAAT